MRRLNRREYQNTMQELLGVTVDVKSLPEDGGGGAYDTSGSTQFLSSDQFEQYLKMGKAAVLEAFKLRENKVFTSPMVFRVEPEETVNPFSVRSTCTSLFCAIFTNCIWTGTVSSNSSSRSNSRVGPIP